MEKEEIIKMIKQSLEKPTAGRNSMGCSESNYDPYYMVGGCFSEDEINAMENSCLENLIKLANYASDAFY